jgi:ArsR family transcriptional regulator
MEELLASLRAAGDPTRLRLLRLCAQGEWTVSELTQSLALSQPLVSRHLKQLCDAGLIERRPEGSWVFHRLRRDGAPGRLARQLIESIPHDDALVVRDNDRLAAIRRARASVAAEYFRANAARWDEIRALHVNDAEVESALLRLLPPAAVGELLDIGTGTGRILELFGSHGVRGVGVDLSREMLALARANLDRAGLGECYVRQGDMYHLPWGTPEFDAVTIHQVLHYADDPAAAIAEAARVLKPGGRMVIADFAPHGLDALRTEHAHRRLGFADAEMRDWVGQAGLEPGDPVSLPGEALTIRLWPAQRRAPHLSLLRSA